MTTINLDRNSKRKARVSKNIIGTKTRPRISIYKSSKYIYAQSIDDEKRITLASCSSFQLSKRAGFKKEKKIEAAKDAGLELGNLLKKLDINAGVFDRGRYTFTGRVKALYQGLKTSGIKI